MKAKTCFVFAWLLAAGPLDAGTRSMDEFTGKEGIVLRVPDASNGDKLAQYQPDAMPARDGLIIADRKLYITTQGNRIICFHGERPDE